MTSELSAGLGTGLGGAVLWLGMCQEAEAWSGLSSSPAAVSEGEPVLSIGVPLSGQRPGPSLTRPAVGRV